MSEFDFDIDLFCEQLTDDWVLDEIEKRKEKENESRID
jgi:hypothetical protein